MQTVLDKAQDDLEKAQEAARELNLSLLVTIQLRKPLRMSDISSRLSMIGLRLCSISLTR